MKANLPDQIRRASDELVAWVANYDAEGRTYRDFWVDYSIAAGAFDALTSGDQLSDDLADLVCSVRDLPVLMGFEPEALDERPAIDDLIIGKQKCLGARS